MKKELKSISDKLYKSGLSILKTLLKYNETSVNLNKELEQFRELYRIKEQELDLEKKELILKHNKNIESIEHNKQINEACFNSIADSIKEFDYFHHQVLITFEKLFYEINHTKDSQKRNTLKEIREKYYNKLIDGYLQINSMIDEVISSSNHLCIL